MRAAGPTVAVALNVAGLPVAPVALTAIVFTPRAVPRVQLPTVAMPVLFVVCVGPVIAPPPLVTLNVTLTPATPAPEASLNLTDGATLTAPPVTADWSFPALIAMMGGGVGGTTESPPPQ
jgi:hypothetical protein